MYLYSTTKRCVIRNHFKKCKTENGNWFKKIGDLTMLKNNCIFKDTAGSSFRNFNFIWKYFNEINCFKMECSTYKGCGRKTVTLQCSWGGDSSMSTLCILFLARIFDLTICQLNKEFTQCAQIWTDLNVNAVVHSAPHLLYLLKILFHSI